MALIEDGIRQLLVTASVGVWEPVTETDWTIFVGKLPVTDKRPAIGIMKAGGLTPNPKWLVDWPSIQVMVRGAPNGYQAAAAKAQAIKDTLLGIPSQAIDGDNWNGINMIGDIASLGFDSENRPLFSLNFSLIIEPASGTNREAL